MRRHAGGGSRESVTFLTRSVQETPSCLLLQEDDDNHSGGRNRQDALKACVYLPHTPHTLLHASWQ